MELGWYLALLALVSHSGVHCGGHGEKHHSHVRLHVPEFHHHDHHTKVITIHHHHGKPKKEQHHHHHHHHHQTPSIPHHHYNHNKKTTLTTHTVKKEHKNKHGHHKHHGHHGHHSHHGHHGSHGDDHYQDESPSYNEHDIPNFHDEFVSYTPHTVSSIPSIPTYGGHGITAQVPRIHGVQHTVKQVKVFDSLPSSFPNVGETHGYEVTEEAEGEDDAFSSINSIQNSFPGTIGYVRAAAPGPSDSLTSLTSAGHDPLEAGAQFDFGEQDSYSSLLPVAGLTAASLAAAQQEQFPAGIQPGGIDASTAYEGNQGIVGSILVDDELTDDTPVSFSREAGLQQTINTGGVQTELY